MKLTGTDQDRPSKTTNVWGGEEIRRERLGEGGGGAECVMRTDRRGLQGKSKRVDELK